MRNIISCPKARKENYASVENRFHRVIGIVLRKCPGFFEKEWNGLTERFYHTGDLCYIDNEDDLMLYGRLDSQAKIQGYRVELGEIEHHAREYLKGNNAVVLTFAKSIGIPELAIFVEGRDRYFGFN